MVPDGSQWNGPGRPRALARDGAVPLAPESAPVTTSEETIFGLIADRARSHSVSHLAITATVGLVDAIALGLAHRSAWSVAALFAAAGAYGLWGLVDRALMVRVERGQHGTPATNVIRVVREMIALLGFAALMAAAGGMFGASLGGWRH